MRQSLSADERGQVAMTNPDPEKEKEEEDRIIAQIIELERDFYFENKGKDSERRRRLRDIIERSTPRDRS